MSGHPAAQNADREQYAEGDAENHNRGRGRSARIAAFDPSEDVQRDDFRLERDVPRDEDERPELADRARERERDARQDRRQDARQDDAQEDPGAARTKRRGSFLHLAVQLEQHRLHRSHDERQGHEEQREDDPGALQADVDGDGRPRPVESE